MKILFEEQVYSPELLEDFGLGSYMAISRDGYEAVVPYVGYVYSPKINDSIFILPKVFMYQGKGDVNRAEFAFGRFHYLEILDVSKNNNPLKADGIDRVLFGLSTWIYQAIERYSVRHPDNRIVRRSYVQRVSSNKGEDQQTLLDTILSLIAFHREHSSLFTYISIINSSGNNKIHWSKTISKVQPIIKNNEPYYVEFRNKNKTINYDEELIILFYSVLEYLRAKYFFPVRSNLNYELIKPSKIEAMIESGRGTKLLRSIRKKYFKDELVLLWKLLFAFFDKSEVIRSGKYREEALVVSTFNKVFEDMVDTLIGDDVYSDLKDNEDGKQIDHLYKDKSFLDDSLIYYIGDSKYYFSDHKLESKSLYKQFTYAKNIIQLNIDIENRPERERTKEEQRIISGVRYRDKDTEGYNITPNYFVRGYIKDGDISTGHANYTDDHVEEYPQDISPNKHFENRLFDRDTLVLKAFNINFLFVLASYVNTVGNDSAKKHIHEVFRTKMKDEYNKNYDFFKVQPLSDVEDFIETNFRYYLGKMYRPKGEPFIWFAYNKNTMTLAELQGRFEGKASVVMVEI